jgi:hypothetical protein
LEALCLTALAKDPKARFGSMAEFAAALEDFLGAGNGSPSSAPADGPSSRIDSAQPLSSPLAPPSGSAVAESDMLLEGTKMHKVSIQHECR